MLRLNGFRIVYDVTDTPPIEDVIKSLQGWNSIIEALNDDLRRYFEEPDLSIKADVASITQGSLAEDFLIRLVFKSDEAYQKFLNKFGELPVLEKTLLVLLGFAAAFGVNSFMGDAPQTIQQDNRIFVLSDKTAESIREAIPLATAVSRHAETSMTAFGQHFSLEDLRMVPERYEAETDEREVAYLEQEISLRAVNFDGLTRWYGEFETEGKTVKARLKFLDPADADRIKESISSSEIKFRADADVVFKKGRSGEYKASLITIKNVY